jgi:hypothetical protein
MRITKILVPLLFIATAACSSGGGDDDDDDDGGGGGGGDCGFDSDRYLPFEAGFSWTYKVTDLDPDAGGATAMKEQSLTAVTDPDYDAVIQQITGKLDGSTRSLLKVDGDRVIRLKQEDLTTAGDVERTTTYDPGQIRIDETPARLEEGTTFEESYDETVMLAAGGTTTTPTTDEWEVVGFPSGDSCKTPAGTFDCIQLRRTRTAGGVAVKDFFFAKGVGKVKESGDSQLEELVSCENTN